MTTEHPAGPPRGTAAMSVARWGPVAPAARAAAASRAGAFGARHGTGGGVRAATAVAGGHASPASASAPLYYCPMHVTVVQDHPGECPICSMTLVPKTAGSAAPERTGSNGLPGLAEVDLSPERIQ